MDELQFEWDEDKNIANIKKHHVDFNDAIMVFADEHRIELYDESHSYEEDRYNTIGMVGELLFVVYTERKEVIRMISARLANRYERRLYYDR